MESNQKTILLVEDQVIISMMETQQLTQAGYNVLTAQTGEEAVKICKEQGKSIHLILMDIDLGIGINGADAAKEILKNHEIPVVFLSSHIEKEVVETTEKITSYGYVVKNSGEVVLLASIKMAFKLYDAHQKIINKNREIETVNQKLQETIEELQETSEEFEAANEDLLASQKEILAQEEALMQSEMSVRKKLEAILSPQGDIGGLSLKDIIDIQEIKSLMEHYYLVTHIVSAIVDLEGKVLVSIGWQDICVNFHRKNPETCKNCKESDIYLSQGAQLGEFKKYKCKNNLWDISTPIIINGKHLGNIFIGQFFLEGEEIDFDVFREQAKRYGFNEKEYIDSLNKVPRLTESQVENTMKFYSKFAEMISLLSYRNIQLARSLNEKESLLMSLKKSEEENRAIVQAVPDIIFNVNKDGIILNYRAQQNTLLYAAPENFIHKKFMDILPSEVASKLKIAMDRAFETKELVNIEYELSLNKEIYYFENRIIAISENESLSFIRDITEKKQAEKAIKENAQFLQIILDSLPNPIFYKDAKLVYKGCNKAFEEFIKTSQENLISKTVYGLFPKEFADIYQAMDIQLLQNPGIQSYESKIINLEGERKEVLFHKATFEINGKVEGIVGTMIDLTEKKKAEKALIESEERFRLLFERNNAVMLLIEPESGKILDTNLAAEQFYGYSHEKLRSMNIDDINMLPPIEVKKERMQALDNQRNYFVFPHKLANGEMRTVEVHSTPIITYGKLVLFSIVHDITNRLEMEKALLESERKYRNIFENIQDIFYQTDINGIITEISPSIKRYSGFERDELIGTPIESVYYNPEDRLELLKIINEKGEVSDYELRLKNKFNEEIIASINAHPLFDTAGRWIGTEGSLRDVTCRKKVEYALRESEEQLRTLINSMPDIVCFKDGSGRWIEANEFDLELFDLTGIDYKGLKDSELAQYQTFYKKVFLECELLDEIAWKAGKMVRSEEVIPLPEGPSKVFDIIKVPLFHKDGARKGLVVIGRDITKLKEKEEMLNKAILQKETLMKELQHRVKNNLLVVTSLLSLEMNKLTDVHSQEIFHNALSRINSIASLYERLALSESLENVDFHIYLNNLANSIFESYLVEKGKIVLKTSLEKLELKTRVAVPLGLVLNELITNVLKYAYPNEKKGELRITLRKEEGKGVLIVEDDGIGFPDELNTEKSNSLGLKLIRMIVKQIPGEVKIESEKGTKVSVYFTI